MAVALRGYTQAKTSSSSSQTLAWPAGSAVGDLAVLEADHASGSGPGTSGWTYAGTSIYFKSVTSADLSGSIPVKGRLVSLVVFTGAARIGATTQQRGVRVAAGGAAFIRGWTGPFSGSGIGPSTGRLGSAVQLSEDRHWHATWWVASASAAYVSISSDGDADGYRGYEIVPTAGPGAPVLTSPSAGSTVDVAVPVTLSWVPTRESPTGVPDGWRVSIRAVGSGTWQWVTSSGTLTASETSVASGAVSATINAGVLTSGQAYEWRAATSESTRWSPYSGAQQFTPVSVPTATGVTVSSLLDDLSPTVSWTATASFGDIIAHRVRVIDSGMVVADSGVRPGNPGSYTIPPREDWVNSATVTASVEVQQTGGLWSAPGTANFAVTWTPPTSPNAPACVDGSPFAVTVTGIQLGLGLQVQSSTDGGFVWVPVRDIPAPALTQSVPVPLAAYGVATAYRVRTYRVLEGVRLGGAWVESGACVSTDRRCYLVSDDGSEWLAVSIRDEDAVTVVQGLTVSYGLGSTRPRVDRSPTQGLAGRLTLVAESIAERDAIVSWLTTRDVWWLSRNPEPSRAWGSPHVDVPPIRQALADSLDVARIANLPLSVRDITYAWVEQ